MDDQQRNAIFNRMRAELMRRAEQLLAEQAGVHTIDDVLPLVWLSLADIAGRNIGIGRRLGHVPAAQMPIVTMIASALLGNAAQEAMVERNVRPEPKFSYDWGALLHGTAQG